MANNKKSGWVKGLVLLAILGGAGYGGYTYIQRPADTGPSYRTATIVRGDITQIVTANGQISPVKSVTVGSQVSGIINDIKVDFNSIVKEGDIIAQIDPSILEQSVTQSRADLMSAKAAMELAELNYKRSKALNDSKLISQADADKALVDMHQAEAVVEMRQASLKNAEVNLGHATIYAPISGVVISRSVDVGQTVAASFNTPNLFLIANDLKRMQIELMVSEADVGGILEGQNVAFTVDAFPGRNFAGTVRQVRFAPTTNQNVVTYVSVVDVNNEEMKLRPGMTANALVTTARKKDVIRIPNGALRFKPPITAKVTGTTNAFSPAMSGGGAGGSTNQLAAAAGGASAAGAGPDGAGREEMRRRMESMSPEERAAFREQMRASRGGGAGGPGGMQRGNPDAPVSRVVYLAGSTNAPGSLDELKGVVVKTGISDGSFTEVLDGLKEGDVVVVGQNIVTSSSARPSTAPTSPFGGGMRPPR